MKTVTRTLSLSFLLLCGGFVLAAPAGAQCPAKTTVSDTLLNADGSPATGRVVIAWPTFLAGNCQVIAGQATIAVANGQLGVELYPNDAATPAGTSYRVTYYLKSGRISTEYWVVPASSTPVNLAVVRASSVPFPAVMFGQAQIINLIGDLARKIELPSPCPAGKFLQASGAATPPQVDCVDSTGAPLATPTVSGTVKVDVTEADPQVYTRTTSDVLLAGKAATSHAHDATDVASGVLNPARLPTPTPSTLGAVKSGACSGSDKVSAISDTGAITCASDLTGAGTQHQVNGVALVTNDPVNFQDSTTIAFSNPSAGNIQASPKDGSITAAKLSVASPSAAQLSGVGNDNIAAAALAADRISGVAVTQSRALNASSPLSGGGDLSADRTLTCPTCEVNTNKGAASGYASLDSSSKVVQDPANATATPTAGKIPIADGGGKFAAGWLPTPGASSLGGVLSKTCTGTEKLSAIGTDGVPVCSTDQTGGGSTHAMLSVTHTDTTAASVARGDLIAGIGAIPTWQRVAKGDTNTYPKWDPNGDLIASAGPSSGTGSCTNQFVRALNADAAPGCASVGTDDLAASAVTRDKVSAVLRTRQIGFIIGADNGPALVDADDQATIFYNSLGGGITITAVWCETDQGTSTINLQRDDGSPVNILSSNLTCSTSGASGTVDTDEDNVASTEKIDFVMMTAAASGTPKRITVFITFTVD